MPVTTRAAALRSQVDGNLIDSQDQATSTPTSTVKTTRKYPSRQKCKSVQVKSITSSSEPEIHLPSQQQSTNLGAASEVLRRFDQEDLVLTKADATVGTLFADQSSTPPHFNKGTRIHQEENE